MNPASKNSQQKPMGQKPQPAESKNELLLALLLFVAAGVLYYAYQSTPKKAKLGSAEIETSSSVGRISGSSSAVGNAENTSGAESNRVPSSAIVTDAKSEAVSRHMQKTAQQLMLERQKVEVENKLYAPDISKLPNSNVYDNKATGVDLSVDQTSLQTAKELGRASEDMPSARSPHEVVQQEIYEDLQMKAYTESYRKEYIRQYIENARKNGYELKVDPQGRVTSVKKIRPDDKFNVFSNSRGSGTNH